MNNDKQQAADFEERVKADLTAFLQKKGSPRQPCTRMPRCRRQMERYCRAYLPDGAREFSQYPVVSLGWMMLTGMAAAYFWDTDWEKYAPRDDIYEYVRDLRGYDNMDEAVVEDLLGYKGEAAEKISGLVAECAAESSASSTMSM